MQKNDRLARAARIPKVEAHAVDVRRANALTVLAALPPQGCDLIFLDPPFESDLFDKALAAAATAITTEGFIYLEAPGAWTDLSLSPLGLSLWRHVKAGAVHAHLLRRAA